MSLKLKPFLAQLADGGYLSTEDSEKAFDIIMSELKKSGILDDMQSPFDSILDVRTCR